MTNDRFIIEVRITDTVANLTISGKVEAADLNSEQLISLSSEQEELASWFGNAKLTFSTQETAPTNGTDAEEEWPGYTAAILHETVCDICNRRTRCVESEDMKYDELVDFGWEDPVIKICKPCFLKRSTASW